MKTARGHLASLGFAAAAQPSRGSGRDSGICEDLGSAVQRDGGSSMEKDQIALWGRGCNRERSELARVSTSREASENLLLMAGFVL